jgi:hypothetical protein
MRYLGYIPQAIDGRISRREATTNESSEVVFIPGGISIITSDTSIYVSKDVDIVGTIHHWGIIFWCIYFHLPNSITKYTSEWNVDFFYHLKAEPIFCSRGTKFLTVAM